MNRRGFLQSCLIACAAPAIVRADSLMKIIPIKTKIIQPEWLTEELKIIISLDHHDFIRQTLCGYYKNDIVWLMNEITAKREQAEAAIEIVRSAQLEEIRSEVKKELGL